VTALPRRRLGASDLEISPVGVGTAPMGSSPEWSIYWGRQDEEDAIRAIHAAIDEGVNWIDTAPFYGWGRAEEIIGRAIPGSRDRVLIFTKCGTVRLPDDDDRMDLRPSTIRRDLEATLRRLGTDHVDLLQPHDTDDDVPIEESWAEVHSLVEEGKVRFAGLSNHPPELIERALAVGPVVSAQHQYNLISRGIEQDVLPFCRERNIGVLSWGSLAEGLLTEEFDLDALEPEDFRRQRPNFQEPRYSHIRRLTAELSAIGRDHGRSAQDVALAWMTSRDGLTGAIVGVRSEREARALASAARWEVPHDMLRRVDGAVSRFDESTRTEDDR
jgi:aryl-alcohol dehydrogenase-like predicted oxidoreductase